MTINMPVKKLGFGCMRLPLTDPENQKSIDLEKFCEMVDTFLERGFTYFDTAYMYHKYQSSCIMKYYQECERYLCIVWLCENRGCGIRKKTTENENETISISREAFRGEGYRPGAGL